MVVPFSVFLKFFFNILSSFLFGVFFFLFFSLWTSLGPYFLLVYVVFSFFTLLFHDWTLFSCSGTFSLWFTFPLEVWFIFFSFLFYWSFDLPSSYWISQFVFMNFILFFFPLFHLLPPCFLYLIYSFFIDFS
jgi:hypothetical protein